MKYWLDINGARHAAGEDHASAARQILRNRMPASDSFRKLLRQGWARIIVDSGSVMFNMGGNHKEPNPAQLRALKEWAKETGKELVDDTAGRRTVWSPKDTLGEKSSYPYTMSPERFVSSLSEGAMATLAVSNDPIREVTVYRANREAIVQFVEEFLAQSKTEMGMYWGFYYRTLEKYGITQYCSTFKTDEQSAAKATELKSTADFQLDLLNSVASAQRALAKNGVQFDTAGYVPDASEMPNREMTADDIIDLYNQAKRETDPAKKDALMQQVRSMSQQMESKLTESDAIKKPDDLKAKLEGVSLGQDKKGYYVFTHRARSKSYKTPHDIPQSAIDFIESTG